MVVNQSIIKSDAQQLTSSTAAFNPPDQLKTQPVSKSAETVPRETETHLISDLLPAAGNNGKDPIHSSRPSILLLSVFIVIGFLTGSFFYAWPPTQVLYSRSGAYQWLCSGRSLGGGLLDSGATIQRLAPIFDKNEAPLTKPRTSRDLKNIKKKYNNNNGRNNKSMLSFLYDGAIFDSVCEAQLEAIDCLMPIGVASMFVFALAGGLAVDRIGLKFSAILGLTFQIAGWILLAFSTQHFPLYIGANILMGFGNEPMYIALLSIFKMFPEDRKGLIIGMISGARSMSFVIPSIMNYILVSYPTYVTVQTVYLAYVAVLILCWLGVLLIFPRECPYGSSFSNQPSKPDSQFIEDDRSSVFSRCWSIIGDKEWDSASVAPSHYSVRVDKSFCSATTVGSLYTVSSKFHPSRALPAPTSGNLVVSPSVGEVEVPRGIFCHPFSSSSPPEKALQTHTLGASSSESSFMSIVDSLLYLPLLPIAATTILSGTFFANSSQVQLQSALPVFIFLTPFSFLFGILMGYLTDSYGPLSVMGIMYLLNLLQFILLLLGSLSLVVLYMAAVVSFFVQSFFLTQFYCYIALAFPQRHFGSLSGFLLMCSGLFSLIVTPMCEFASIASDYLAMNGLCLTFSVTNIFFLYLLYKSRETSTPHSIK